MGVRHIAKQFTKLHHSCFHVMGDIPLVKGRHGPFGTLHKISFRVRANVFKLLKPGKTKGSALVHIVYNVFRRDCNDV